MEERCKECGKKFGFGDYWDRDTGYCHKCCKVKLKHCRICGKKLSIWTEQGFAQTHDFMCKNCWETNATQEQRNRLPSSFSVADFEVGKDTVVIITQGDAEFKLAIKKAEKYGYELVNMTQSQDNWSFLETKRTLIFKKIKDRTVKDVDRSEEKPGWYVEAMKQHQIDVTKN